MFACAVDRARCGSQVNGVVGVVSSIGLCATCLVNEAMVPVYMPNDSLASAQVENLSRRNRYQLTVEVAPLL